jgi:hypothetical protein
MTKKQPRRRYWREYRRRYRLTHIRNERKSTRPRGRPAVHFVYQAADGEIGIGRHDRAMPENATILAGDKFPISLRCARVVRRKLQGQKLCVRPCTKSLTAQPQPPSAPIESHSSRRKGPITHRNSRGKWSRNDQQKSIPRKTRRLAGGRPSLR